MTHEIVVERNGRQILTYPFALLGQGDAGRALDEVVRLLKQFQPPVDVFTDDGVSIRFRKMF